MRIYIAGPYGKRNNAENHTLEQNVQVAISVARELIARGHEPLVPHLYHFVDLDWEETCGEDRWLEICLSWIPCCDALYYIGPSYGADMEKAKAEVLNIPVYETMEDIPDVGWKQYYVK